MKYRRGINTNFNYIGANLASFAYNKGLGIGLGIGAGALAGGIGANIYNQNQIKSNRTPQEANRLKRYGDRFNQGYEGWQNAENKGFIADRSTPEGRRFIDSGDKFLNENQRITDKYSNKPLVYGSLAGGALAGGGLSYLLSRGKKL